MWETRPGHVEGVSTGKVLAEILEQLRSPGKGEYQRQERKTGVLGVQSEMGPEPAFPSPTLAMSLVPQSHYWGYSGS